MLRVIASIIGLVGECCQDVGGGGSALSYGTILELDQMTPLEAVYFLFIWSRAHPVEVWTLVRHGRYRVRRGVGIFNEEQRLWLCDPVAAVALYPYRNTPVVQEMFGGHIRRVQKPNMLPETRYVLEAVHGVTAKETLLGVREITNGGDITGKMIIRKVKLRDLGVLRPPAPTPEQIAEIKGWMGGQDLLRGSGGCWGPGRGPRCWWEWVLREVICFRQIDNHCRQARSASPGHTLHIPHHLELILGDGCPQEGLGSRHLRRPLFKDLSAPFENGAPGEL